MAGPRTPCRIGDALCDIDTPALLVDLDKLEENLKTMPITLKEYSNLKLRPHAKSHKCPTLARLQVTHGAVGVCVQKLTEAQAMVHGGVEDVLVTNEIVSRSKLCRLMSLAQHATISIVVDSQQNIRDLSDAAQQMGVDIGVLVDVNVGMPRCGVLPGPEVVQLASLINSLPNVTLKGLHCYQGANQHIRKAEERAEATAAAVEKAATALKALEDAEISCDYVTGGGTGTYMYEAKSGVFTEVQPGSYVFMDADYGRNFGEDGQPVHQFHQSLFVLATVQSVPEGNRAVVDAGLKAISMDSGVPLVYPNSDIVYHCGGDEHGVLVPPGKYKIGDQVWLIPGHCDPTVNLYDWLVGVRGGRVEAMWPITGRGPGV
ncbi:3-hydroxy-D-aspartate aldolase-like isoform X1 [Branchiostoma floridae]|uniref:3-hydroxy-D-aspartate aldolase-like isoform X1 n=1 Tax=Branchiostoma floridae TaxID=7739 RepID=A0A9J7KMP5_BRAFL|nr:3-hydroxy-D-aspartate aldolase-like isoform X1 [Branchiostoma floridae]